MFGGIPMSREGVMTLAKADCALCEMMGFRSCDTCGNPTMPDPGTSVLPAPDVSGRELCVYCL